MLQSEKYAQGHNVQGPSYQQDNNLKSFENFLLWEANLGPFAPAF
jgi:hypothetical protein